MSPFRNDADFSRRLDEQDELAHFRDQFLFPSSPTRTPLLYFAGNSLGLQPKRAREFIGEELDDWARLAVEGHMHARHPWLPYHEFLCDSTARIVGALPSEVVVMNTLSVNLHLMMVSFYRPSKTRFKILVERGAFPSDQYAVASQARFHGFDPVKAIVELAPRPGENTLRHEDILRRIELEGTSIALILIGNVNYLTGQAFAQKEITHAGHKAGCMVGFDLAHAAGNLELALHDDGADFAVWCSYKYLNAGPGAIAGCFVHERHHKRTDLPRLEGWWGTNKATRFQMNPSFDAIPTAEAWQLSNPGIFQLAALRASMEIFDEATMPRLRAKSKTLTAYLEFLLGQELGDAVSVITPRAPNERGAHLSLRVRRDPKRALNALAEQHVICDFREPDVIRVAPVPLYTRFQDVFRFVQILKSICA